MFRVKLKRRREMKQDSSRTDVLHSLPRDGVWMLCIRALRLHVPIEDPLPAGNSLSLQYCRERRQVLVTVVSCRKSDLKRLLERQRCSLMEVADVFTFCLNVLCSTHFIPSSCTAFGSQTESSEHVISTGRSCHFTIPGSEFGRKSGSKILLH
jgi:hypothetical protein